MLLLLMSNFLEIDFVIETTDKSHNISTSHFKMTLEKSNCGMLLVINNVTLQAKELSLTTSYFLFTKM